ncbi:MAG TPA: phosphatidate cytidylyltransferase, partial [Gaiellaceae bacterium]|nr:phosphatidate cytidylyltransferase [Gaiellaceae bacterium]
MTSLLSRAVVAAVLLPLVIGVVYLGGWWLVGLALAGGILALHELYTMARALRPLVLAGYVGYVLAILGLELGGIQWMVGGIVSTFFFSFVIFGLSDVRPSATASFGVTVLGVTWVGAGIGFLLLVRDIPEFGF